MITKDDICICDHCGGDQGEFDESGNHPICAELDETKRERDALKAENAQLFQVANRAMAVVLQAKPEDYKKSAELKELDGYMENQIDDALWWRLDGCISEQKASDK
jgi:hypothetical protein